MKSVYPILHNNTNWSVRKFSILIISEYNIINDMCRITADVCSLQSVGLSESSFKGDNVKNVVKLSE